MSAPTRDRATPARRRVPLLLVAAALSMLLVFGGSTAAAASRSTTLSLGSTGPAVKKLQRRLHVRPVSGYFGPKTQRAVRRFQRRHGLKADGIAGPATLRRLGLRVTSAGYATGGASPSKRHRHRHRARSRVRVPAILRKIARCESGGNPRAVSRTGRYRGKYQFSMDTWHAWGGRGDPIDASEATQDRIALRLYRARGTAPWPNCG
jgi:resuscitation-promoting factor RpfB